MFAELQISDVSALVALILLVSSSLAVYFVFRSKRVEASLDVFAKMNQELRDSNDELRASIEFERKERERDGLACDKAIAEERHQREIASKECDKQIAAMEAKFDVMTGDIGRRIADVAATAAATAATSSVFAALQVAGINLKDGDDLKGDA